MKSFSQRKGLTPIRDIIQKDGMDDELRNSLWNVLCIHYWEWIVKKSTKHYPPIRKLFRKLWLDLFKKPIDTIPHTLSSVLEEVREHYFRCEWYEVYDFIEAVASTHPSSSVNRGFMNGCNNVLERESSAYRFVDGQITEITSEQEIEAIEDAIGTAPKPAATHIEQALAHFANRESPDYRNSIKESISAVEAMCKLIAGSPNATLGSALKEIDKQGKVQLHSALTEAFKKLYGYTSGADGIRHALLDESNLNAEDAKFMLVSCSSFVNYLVVKSSKAGIKLE